MEKELTMDNLMKEVASKQSVYAQTWMQDQPLIMVTRPETIERFIVKEITLTNQGFNFLETMTLNLMGVSIKVFRTFDVQENMFVIK